MLNLFSGVKLSIRSFCFILNISLCLFVLTAAGTPEDKLRLFLIYYMSGPPISPVSITSFI